MLRWRQILLQLANSAETGVDTLKHRLDARWGSQSLSIVAYHGYGTIGELYIKARVLRDHRVHASSETDSAWRNLRSMYRRFASDEVPYAKVLARAADAELQFTADEEGFVDVRLKPVAPLSSDQLWHDVALTLLEPAPTGEPVQAIGRVLVPPSTCKFGVISDIDDTVLRTDATSMLRALRATFFQNAYSRLPFAGVAELYQALQFGDGDSPSNPLFYVSSSPWNLFDMLDDFLSIQRIPNGPLMLRDWGLSSDGADSPLRHKAYKLGVICQILDTYPALPFVLLGDSGQEDPEIYREVVHRYPNRILAVYIRNVSKSLERRSTIEALAREVAEAGSTLVLADDTLAAARHAAEHGWITDAQLAAVQRAVQQA
jgi:phosphatidate phosphatase APP1